jgi:hypothetical protein
MYKPQREGSFEMGYSVNMEGIGYDQVTTIKLISESVYVVSIIFLRVTELSLARVFPLILSTTYLVMQVTVSIGPMSQEDKGLSHSRIHSCTPSGSLTPSPKTPPPPVPLPIPASSALHPLSLNTNPDLLRTITHDPR